MCERSGEHRKVDWWLVPIQVCFWTTKERAPGPQLRNWVVALFTPVETERAFIGSDLKWPVRLGHDDKTFTRIAPASEDCRGGTAYGHRNVDGTIFIATYGYGVERLQVRKGIWFWPLRLRINGKSRLGRDASGRLALAPRMARSFLGRNAGRSERCLKS